MMKTLILFMVLLSTTASAHHRAYRQTGLASWYGPGFYGHKTSNGEIFTGRGLTAAHNSLPLGSRVKVINLHNHRSVIVRINDRGSFTRKYHRLIDLSPRAARSLRMLHAGTIKVIVVALRTTRRR